ncbi:hypothetical protein ACFQ8T_12575 [Isoptericola sp. NPDC056618]|uniref:hypothetical protein n=1 Tax=Isoptericola sp. NPDC056618 TaxID=3345878 RepID=UPI0036AC57CF
MPSTDGRSASDSLCTQPTEHAREFHFHSSPFESTSVRNEIVDALYDAARTPMQAAGLVGDVFGRMRAAGLGHLADDPDEFCPVRSQPELWEMKWKFKRMGEYRLYHAEPGRSPDLVALRFHRKDTDRFASSTEINQRQNVEMELAAARYEAGEDHRWGHTRGCGDCLGD